jgi:hypothetical protein
MDRATSSFPVPDSPVSRTVASVGATMDAIRNTSCMAGELPTTPSNR